jgi:hypothetical protein
MAEKSEKPEGKVRYRVLKPTFVNGTYVDPGAANPVGCERQGKQFFVLAAPGLEGGALELVDKKTG